MDSAYIMTFKADWSGSTTPKAIASVVIGMMLIITCWALLGLINPKHCAFTKTTNCPGQSKVASARAICIWMTSLWANSSKTILSKPFYY